MRVIGGQWGGRRLHYPKNVRVRPTMDSIRESLFNLLTSQLSTFKGLHVLDLFCGFGTIGIEALSRGAASVTFVDKSKPQLRAIHDTLSQWDCGAKVDFVQSDVLRFVSSRKKNEYHFDIIYIDPPYAICEPDYLKQILNSIEENKWASPTAVIIVEHPSRQDLSALPLWEEVKSYGDTALSFFRIQD